MNRLRVKDDPSLVRDNHSNGIINTDDAAYNQYLKKKRLAEKLEEQTSSSEERLNNIEREVSDLKQGIQQILELLKR